MAMDMLKKFKLKIGNIRVDESNQSEKEKNSISVSGIFKNNSSLKYAKIRLKSQLHQVNQKQDENAFIFRGQSEKILIT